MTDDKEYTRIGWALWKIAAVTILLGILGYSDRLANMGAEWACEEILECPEP